MLQCHCTIYAQFVIVPIPNEAHRAHGVAQSVNILTDTLITAWGQLERVDGSSKRRMLRSLSTLSYRRAINFNGYRFNVSIFDQAQEAIRIHGKVDPNSIYAYSGGFRGASGILLGVLAKKLNFAVNAIQPNTNEKYGHQMPNGTLSGAVGNRKFY